MTLSSVMWRTLRWLLICQDLSNKIRHLVNSSYTRNHHTSMGWVGGQNGQLWITRDGGNQWREVNISGVYKIAGFEMFNKDQGVLASNRAVYTTDNGGADWKRSFGVDGNIFQLDIDKNKAWLASASGLFLSENSGKDWVKIPVLIGEPNLSLSGFEAVEFFSGSNGVLLTSHRPQEIWVTHDGGVKWNKAHHPAVDITSFTGKGDRVWSVGYEGAILHSVDGGEHWYHHSYPGRQSALSENERFYRRFPAPWYCLSWLVTAALMVPALRRPKPIELPSESIADIMASDRPLRLSDPDPLQFNEIARSLSRFIRNENTKPPLTVAVTGPWGSGKSSLMNLLSGDLARFGFRPVWFNVWHHQKEEHLFAALLANIRKQAVPPLLTPIPPFLNLDGLAFRYRLLLQRGPRQWLLWLLTLMILGVSAPLVMEGLQADNGQNNWLETLMRLDKDKLWNAFLEFSWFKEHFEVVAFSSALATAVGGLYKAISAFGISPAKLMASLESNRNKAAPLETRLSFRYAFSQEFKEVTSALNPLTMVIMIDDLDRCQPKKVLEVLEAVNFLVSSGECVVVLGMDYDVVQQSIALEYKDLAEQIRKTEPENGESKSESFAAEYLEKLINIQVPVPMLNSQDASKVLTAKAPEPNGWSRFKDAFQSVQKRYGPYLVVIMVLVMGWNLGESLIGKELAEPNAVAAPVERDSSEPSGIRPGQSGVSGETRTESPKPKVANPEKHIISWRRFGIFAGFLFAMALGAVYVRQRIVVVRDSEKFNSALHIWSDVVRTKRNTPRAVKRFLNRTRYFAMRLRDHFDRPEEPHVQNSRSYAALLSKLLGLLSSTETNNKEDKSLNEPILVAMSALHHFNPALLHMAPEELEREVGENHVLKHSIEMHISQFMEWPPSLEQLKAFRELSAGIDVK